MSTVPEEPRTNTEFAMRFSTGRPVVLGVTEIPPNAKTLHFVEASKDFEQLLQHPTVSAMSINGVSIDREARRALEAAAIQLLRVRFLQVWNCSKFDLGLLTLFPGLEYLQLAHKNARNDTWAPLSKLSKLKGLFLVDASRLESLELCQHLGGELNTLSVLGARSLKMVAGIERVKESIRNLTLWGTLEHPPRRRFGDLKVDAIGNLTQLHSLSLSGLEVDETELREALRRVRQLEDLELDPWQFDMRVYARLRVIAPKVRCAALNASIDAGDAVLPVGKGTKMIKRSSANFEAEYARVLANWDEATRAARELE